MILARVSRFSILSSVVIGIASMPGHARADVLELNAEGARWVAGGEQAPVPDISAVILDGATITAPDVVLAPPQNGKPQRVTAELLAAYAAQDEARASQINLNAVPEEALADISVSASAVPPQYVAKVRELSQRFDLSESLIEALVWQESRWRENAVSHAGARGLAQLMPATARYLGVDPDDPMQNLEGGARYLREQLDRFDGDLEKALAAYNAGPGRVIRANGIPNIYETKAYVAAIMGRLASHARAKPVQ